MEFKLFWINSGQRSYTVFRHFFCFFCFLDYFKRLGTNYSIHSNPLTVVTTSISSLELKKQDAKFCCKRCIMGMRRKI